MEFPRIFFSIIIPTYNRAHLITKTIDSVLEQSYPHFEVIIVDDGSTDNTNEVIRNKYADKSHVRYFYKENEERGAARNFGLKKAQGQYAIFFDSDDLMHDNHLQVLGQYIGDLEKVNFIATKHDWLYNNKIKPSTVQKIKEGWYGKDLFIDGNGLACNFCVRTDNTEMILFREGRELVTMEDWIFLLENTGNDKIYLIDKTTLSLVDHNERSLTKNFQETLEKRLFATKWIEKNIPLTQKEIEKLWSSSYVFCSVFSYLDQKNAQSLGFLLKAIKIDGIDKKKLLLFLKNVLFFNRLKKRFS